MNQQEQEPGPDHQLGQRMIGEEVEVLAVVRLASITELLVLRDREEDEAAKGDRTELPEARVGGFSEQDKTFKVLFILQRYTEFYLEGL